MPKAQTPCGRRLLRSCCRPSHPAGCRPSQPAHARVSPPCRCCWPQQQWGARRAAAGTGSPPCGPCLDTQRCAPPSCSCAAGRPAAGCSSAPARQRSPPHRKCQGPAGSGRRARVRVGYVLQTARCEPMGRALRVPPRTPQAALPPLPACTGSLPPASPQHRARWLKLWRRHAAGLQAPRPPRGPHAGGFRRHSSFRAGSAAAHLALQAAAGR